MRVRDMGMTAGDILQIGIVDAVHFTQDLGEDDIKGAGLFFQDTDFHFRTDWQSDSTE